MSTKFLLIFSRSIFEQNLLNTISLKNIQACILSALPSTSILVLPTTLKTLCYVLTRAYVYFQTLVLCDTQCKSTQFQGKCSQTSQITSTKHHIYKMNLFLVPPADGCKFPHPLVMPYTL